MDCLGSKLGPFLSGGVTKAVAWLEIESCGLHVKGLSGTLVLGKIRNSN